MADTIERQSFTHKELAASCFNKVWDILSLDNRTKIEEEEMIHLCHSSFWHWTQVEEHTTKNLSIGYWQLARVYAVANQGENALRYAEKCIDVSNGLEPFYVAYAYEASARAYSILNQVEKSKVAKENASYYTEQVSDVESKSWLINDLETI